MKNNLLSEWGGGCQMAGLKARRGSVKNTSALQCYGDKMLSPRQLAQSSQQQICVSLMCPLKTMSVWYSIS